VLLRTGWPQSSGASGTEIPPAAALRPCISVPIRGVAFRYASSVSPISAESFCGNWIAPRSADPENGVPQPIPGTHKGAGVGLYAISRERSIYTVAVEYGVRRQEVQMADTGFDYDVLIIGSGFGGSVAALRAVEKGYRVGVLEAGRRWPDDQTPKCLNLNRNSCNIS